jgi:hypothetical protein
MDERNVEDATESPETFRRDPGEHIRLSRSTLNLGLPP